MSTDEGNEIAANGWKKAGIFDAIKFALSGLPSLDPLADMCPLIEFLHLRENLSLSSLFLEELDYFREKIEESEMTPTHSGIYALWSNFSIYAKTWVYRPSF